MWQSGRTRVVDDLPVADRDASEGEAGSRPDRCSMDGFGATDFQVRPGGRVVMQRPAKPCTPVRFRPWPPRNKPDGPPLCGPFAVRRWHNALTCARAAFAIFDGRAVGVVAAQRPSIATRQHSPDGEIGRRRGLKIPPPQGDAGSIPAPGTTSSRCRRRQSV